MRRALVVGGSGFLGGRIAALLGDRGIATFRSAAVPGGVRFDATTERLADLLPTLPGDLSHVIVPFGAIDMEGCARDPKATSAVNVVAVIGVLKDALDAGLKPVFISTDYVFDGTKALWRETDPAWPRMAYGAQKLAVEAWLGTLAAPWTVVRLSKIVSGDVKTHSMLGQWVNEVKAGKPQRCAQDQFLAPAWVDDLAGAVVKLADVGATGLFHAAGPERFSRIALLTLLLDKIREVDPAARVPVTPCGLHELPFLEKRPLDTSLSTAKLQEAVAWPFKTMSELCGEIAREHFTPR
jgi:dTDP-4-dehydrorhamnose reductase